MTPLPAENEAVVFLEVMNLYLRFKKKERLRRLREWFMLILSPKFSEIKNEKPALNPSLAFP